MTPLLRMPGGLDDSANRGPPIWLQIDPKDPQTIFDATICRIPDGMYPEPSSPNTPHQIHIMPAGEC